MVTSQLSTAIETVQNVEIFDTPKYYTPLRFSVATSALRQMCAVLAQAQCPPDTERTHAWATCPGTTSGRVWAISRSWSVSLHCQWCRLQSGSHQTAYRTVSVGRIQYSYTQSHLYLTKSHMQNHKHHHQHFKNIILSAECKQ